MHGVTKKLGSMMEYNESNTSDKPLDGMCLINLKSPSTQAIKVRMLSLLHWTKLKIPNAPITAHTKLYSTSKRIIFIWIAVRMRSVDDVSTEQRASDHDGDKSWLISFYKPLRTKMSHAASGRTRCHQRIIDAHYTLALYARARADHDRSAGPSRL